MNHSRIIIMIAVLALLGGCAQIKKAHKPKLEPTPMAPVSVFANPDFDEDRRTPGSLYSESHGSIFSDDKAYRRGDIVLVRVVQNSRGSKSASTDTRRDSSISARIRYLLGLEESINGLNGYTDNTTAVPGTAGWNPENLIEASSSSQFQGEGSVERNDTLQATISVIVTEVLNNGNLVVYGSEEVTLNNEASMLTVQGIVRPSDINVENQVDSMRIANAKIEFSGDGVVTDKQHPGWMMRGFDWVWPF